MNLRVNISFGGLRQFECCCVYVTHFIVLFDFIWCKYFVRKPTKCERKKKEKYNLAHNNSGWLPTPEVKFLQNENTHQIVVSKLCRGHSIHFYIHVFSIKPIACCIQANIRYTGLCFELEAHAICQTVKLLLLLFSVLLNDIDYFGIEIAALFSLDSGHSAITLKCEGRCPFRIAIICTTSNATWTFISCTYIFFEFFDTIAIRAITFFFLFLSPFRWNYFLFKKMYIFLLCLLSFAGRLSRSHRISCTINVWCVAATIVRLTCKW